MILLDYAVFPVVSTAEGFGSKLETEFSNCCKLNHFRLVCSQRLLNIKTLISNNNGSDCSHREDRHLNFCSYFCYFYLNTSEMRSMRLTLKTTTNKIANYCVDISKKLKKKNDVAILVTLLIASDNIQNSGIDGVKSYLFNNRFIENNWKNLLTHIILDLQVNLDLLWCSKWCFVY